MVNSQLSMPRVRFLLPEQLVPATVPAPLKRPERPTYLADGQDLQSSWEEYAQKTEDYTRAEAERVELEEAEARKAKKRQEWLREVAKYYKAKDDLDMSFAKWAQDNGYALKIDEGLRTPVQPMDHNQNLISPAGIVTTTSEASEQAQHLSPTEHHYPACLHCRQCPQCPEWQPCPHCPPWHSHSIPPSRSPVSLTSDALPSPPGLNL